MSNIPQISQDQDDIFILRDPSQAQDDTFILQNSSQAQDDSGGNVILSDNAKNRNWTH